MSFATIRSGRLKRLSLTTRLAAWYVGLLAVLLLVLGVALYAGATRLSSTAAIGEASIEAHNMRDALEPVLTAAQPIGPAAQAVVNARSMRDNLVVVTDATGQAVAQAAGSSERFNVVTGVGLGVLQGAADEWIGVIDADAVGPLAVSIAGLVDPVSGAVLGAIQVGAPVAQAERTVHMFLLVVAIGFGIVLVAAAVVGPRLTRLGLQPLRTMAQASRSLAAGDLSTRVQSSDVRDEVGELARAFNDMAERLEASFAAQRSFVADASHELRTPLTALGGQIDVLVRVMDARPDEARRLAGFMRREVGRLSLLVDELLVLARVEARGAAALHMQKLDLGSVARDVYEQARVLPVARGRNLHLRVVDAPVVVRGEPRRLHQVLLNLTTNALQHAPDGGRVTLSVERHNEWVNVQVRDDGPGIPAEHLAHVFDRFYRTDAARARVEGGYGGALFSVALPPARPK